MDKEFLPYAESLALKELGFDEMCFAYYGEANTLRFDRFVSKNKSLLKAPLYQQAFRWFRKNHKILVENHVGVNHDTNKLYYSCWVIVDYTKHHIGNGNFSFFDTKILVGDKEANMGVFYTPEEAELACIRKLIEIVKEG